MPVTYEKFPFHIDWDSIPLTQQKLYKAALAVANSQWQKSIVVEMFSPQGSIRPITKLSRGNNLINRTILESLIQRLNSIPGIEVFTQEAEYPAQRSYRINLPFDNEPFYKKPSKFWDRQAIPPEPVLEPYDINQLLLKLASEKNQIYALPIAERLIGTVLDEEEIDQQLEEVKSGAQLVVYQFNEKKRKVYEEQEKRRQTKYTENQYLKPKEEMYGGVLVTYKIDSSSDREGEYGRRQRAFNYLVKRASARGIQFIRTPVAATVEYTIDYQHAGAVTYLPPMEPNEWINLEAFSKSAMKKRRRKFRIAKKKTDGSVRKFAKVKRQEPVKRKHFVQKMLEPTDFFNKVATQVAPKPEKRK